MSRSHQVNTVSWKIGGEAGFGIMASGLIFAKTCLRSGLHVFDYSEYPSLIRGGHNTYQVAVSEDPLRSWRKEVNILVALNRATVELHLDELSRHAVVVYDRTDPTFVGFKPAAHHREDIQWIGLPLAEIAMATGELLLRNTIAIGATFALLNMEFSAPAGVVKQIFKSKSPEVIQLNLELLQRGYDLISDEQSEQCGWDIHPVAAHDAMLVTGNDALGLGAIQGDCKFYAAYPMTPSSSLLAFLAEQGPKYNMVVRHAEDEIGVVNETVGAAYAGVRAMCGTAGGGFSLMTEAMGLAGMAEVGIVVVEAQRGGPSTGLPTWTEQADFRQVLHASQGDFLKVVLAPGDMEECFMYTQLALNLAAQLQTPVIVMTDKYLAESHASAPNFTHILKHEPGKIVNPSTLGSTKEFQRYRSDVSDGVSPRSLPGMANGLFVANSDEHDEYGYTTEAADVRVRQMDKRNRKVATAKKLLPTPKLIGPAKADVTLVGWGSTKGILEDCLEILATKFHLRANLLHLSVLNPFPADAVAKLLKPAEIAIMIETNQSGQVAGWIAQQTGLDFDHHIRRYDGRPFEAIELAHQIHRLIT